MLIDWFTTAAQIVNFLILVALLKHFLYGPITKAMEKREQRIANLLQEAAAKVEDAQREADLYRQKQQELEDQREALLNRAKQQVEAQRQVLMRQTRAEVDIIQAKWYEAVQREKQTFLQDLRQRAGQQIAMIARRALGDLANVSLEQQIVETFIERLHHLDNSQLKAIRSSSTTNPKHELVIRSTFTIPPEKRSKLIHAIQEQIGQGVEVKFETISEPICGIELHNHGYKISWNLGHYLKELEANMERALVNGTSKAV
ncbi:MAG: ATP F0F1 synthase subunit beta [Xenococcaceae cyanobacterium]